MHSSVFLIYTILFIAQYFKVIYTKRDIHILKWMSSYSLYC
jgi:hypothetical protein